MIVYFNMFYSLEVFAQSVLEAPLPRSYSDSARIFSGLRLLQGDHMFPFFSWKTRKNTDTYMIHDIFIYIYEIYGCPPK